MSGDPTQAILALGGAPLAALMDRAERRLGEIGAVDEHAAGMLAAGGKRLRPLLVFLSADGGSEQLVRAAVAVELVHSATLVHDDVLDGAPLRRGHPTVFAAAGREAATSAGDLLFSRAFAELAANSSPAQLAALSAAGSALAQGELIQREDAGDAGISVERYLERCELKTARLFEAACTLGCLAGGGLSLRGFGRRIGLAFQLLDDVLDVVGPAQRIGKRRGGDLLDGTATLPLLLARERSSALAAIDLRTVRDPGLAEELCDLIAATGATELVRARAAALVAAAKDELPSGLAPGRREMLELVADGVVDRYS
ncbi:MAG: polyprenyl synthetase family protein [Solirubrobacteraceae bacterium]